MKQLARCANAAKLADLQFLKGAIAVIQRSQEFASVGKALKALLEVTGV